MSRYIKPSGPVHVETKDGPMKVEWPDCIKALFSDARLQKSIPVFDLIELRKQLVALTPESPPLRISDGEWHTLKNVCVNCEVFRPEFIHAEGAAEFFRSITDAVAKMDPSP